MEPFEVDIAGATLRGSLFLPRDRAGPVPAAMVIHGSGESDRDNYWYMFFADALVRSGLAVLLPDKRGSGPSEGDWFTTGLDGFARDAAGQVAALRAHPAIDAGRVGVVGISQGGRIAPMVAPLVGLAFVVNISGAAVPLDEQIEHETRQDMREDGLPGILDFLVRPLSVRSVKRRRPEWWATNGPIDPVRARVARRPEIAFHGFRRGRSDRSGRRATRKCGPRVDRKANGEFRTRARSPRSPIATHTFRANPARPARRIADPRLNASHASGSSAVRSSATSDGDSIPGKRVDGCGAPSPRGRFEPRVCPEPSDVRDEPSASADFELERPQLKNGEARELRETPVVREKAAAAFGQRPGPVRHDEDFEKRDRGGHQPNLPPIRGREERTDGTDVALDALREADHDGRVDGHRTGGKGVDQSQESRSRATCDAASPSRQRPSPRPSSSRIERGSGSSSACSRRWVTVAAYVIGPWLHRHT